MNIYVIYGKSTTPGDQSPYKTFVVVAADENGAKQLVPKSIRVDHVEAAKPATGNPPPQVVAVYEGAIEAYNP